MAQRKRKVRRSTKKHANRFELTRLNLLYGLSGAFTLCVVGLLIARPAPLSASETGLSVLAAQTQDPLDSAIGTDQSIEMARWQRIVIDRSDSLATAAFHFAVLPQPSGDQIAISAEWSRQASLSTPPGDLVITLVSADPAHRPQDEKTIRSLVGRLSSRLRIAESAIIWR